MNKKKSFFTIIATERLDLKTIEQAIIKLKIKDYEVRGENEGSWYYPDYPHIELYTDRETFAKLQLILDVSKVYW